MIKDFVQGETETLTEYEIMFDDGAYNGYGFPCDENGKIKDDMSEGAKRNYEWCMAHPEEFVRFNKIISNTRSWRNPNSGTCSCGERIWLTNDYLGACECPYCGQWYNVWGQELLPPNRWEDNYYEDY